MANTGNYQQKTKLNDLNVLPDRHRRSKLQPLVILAFLIWAVLLGLLYPAGRNFLQNQRDFSQAQAEFNQLQEEIDDYQSVEDRLENLQTEIDDTQAESQQIRDRYSEINLETVSWSGILFSITAEIPPGVILDQINQSNTRVEISGSAASYQLVLDLEDNLKTIPEFARVEIDRIQFLRQIENLAEGEQPPEGFDEDFPYLYNLVLDTQGEELQP
jgi:Tfp pilus assembly protein PilN